jgi:hypothetical protein
MGSLANHIRDFCKDNADKCYVCEKYLWNTSKGEYCMGIVIREGQDHLDVTQEFVRYLDELDFDDVNLEFEGATFGISGSDTILYFPCCC